MRKVKKQGKTVSNREIVGVGSNNTRRKNVETKVCSAMGLVLVDV